MFIVVNSIFLMIFLLLFAARNLFPPQVNGVRVLEMNHSDVVALIQALPVDFRLVVARKRELPEQRQPIVARAQDEMDNEPTDFERSGTV